jgi:hypothetical protein
MEAGDSAVGTVSGPRTGRSGDRVMAACSCLWGPPSLLFNGSCRSFQRVKRLECDGTHLPPSRAEVKNEWSCNLLPPIRLHSVDTDNSSFSYTGIIRKLSLSFGSIMIAKDLCMKCWYGSGLKLAYDFIWNTVSGWAVTKVAAVAMTRSTSLTRRKLR